MKKLILPIIAVIFCSWYQLPVLKGKWTFAGGIYNGKSETAPEGYILERRYDAAHFNAFALEKGQKPLKYQSGDYTLSTDSCLETETFSAQPSKLTGKTIRYHYQIRNDTLILSGTLPTGMVVEEYWKREK
jgi:hypothetical protein